MRTVLTAIEQELRGIGSDVGYRSVWQRLVTDHGLVVCKETVRHALRIIDHDGVDRRLRHRLQRRQYKGRGPNFIWHIDGYDKLKPFGFSIHGCIDGYSRRIMWLEVGTSNNDPTVVARYFVNCITEVGVLLVSYERTVVQRTAMLLAFNVSFETIQMTHLEQRRVLCMADRYPIKG